MQLSPLCPQGVREAGLWATLPIVVPIKGASLCVLVCDTVHMVPVEAVARLHGFLGWAPPSILPGALALFLVSGLQASLNFASPFL